MRKIWAPVLGWMAAVGVAGGLAYHAPQEASVLGKVPTVAAKNLDQQPVLVPHHLPSDRTLALVVFSRNQKAEVQSWIEGLRLRQNSGIAWVKLPVLNDPGDDKERSGIEQRILERHAASADRARMLPMFTDLKAFVRAAGLDGTDHASVLVLDRNGNVLARAQGPFDEDKAQALRETMLAQND